MVLGPLGNCHQEFFLEPFSFLLILFCFCIVLAMFPSFALKIVLGNYQNDLFLLNPFRFFSGFFSCFFVFSISLFIFIFSFPFSLNC